MPRIARHLLWISCIAASACSPVDAPADGVADAAPDAASDVAQDIGPRPPSIREAGNYLPESSPLYPGQQAFIHETFGTEVVGGWPPVAFMLQLMVDEPEVFGRQFATFGFIEDPDDDLPVGLKRGSADPSRLQNTCALCHVARLPDGTLWLGAPNGDLDIGAFEIAVNERWVAAGNPSRFSEVELAKKRELGPGRTHAEGGMAQVIPADFPTYFNLGQRAYLNYLGATLDVRTEAHFAIRTMGAGEKDADGVPIVPWPEAQLVDDFVAFLGQMAPPPAPAPADPALAARGAEVFAEARCDRCHQPGVPGSELVVPYDKATDGLERVPGDDPAWPRGSIRTSFWHRIVQEGDPNDPSAGPGDDIVALIEFIVEQGLKVNTKSDGYRTNDLHMLWYTAPYLHNGSVPTLEALLDPPSRPATFTRGAFVLDTTKPANDNIGHTFGAGLSAADRAALVAYLLTL
jgi:mono/diheme cytochrome c family protein